MPKQLTPLPIPPALAAQLERLTPAQRQAFVATFATRQQAQARQQQNQSQPQQPQQALQPPHQPPLNQPGGFAIPSSNFGAAPSFNPANFQTDLQANGMMNLLGTPLPGANTNMGGPMMSMMGQQPNGMGLHRRTPSGNPMPQAGGMGNVSYEMLQSFMQRNADGSGMGTG